ncbi:unnamed protein product [Rhizophagus irregularis]|nr:unnamed protein product [Rhizophagus irregularis]
MAQHSTKLESNLSQTNFPFYDIAMEIHIGNYLDSNNYTNWSTSGLLQYLVEKENYTTEDATIIHNAFRYHLEKKSADHNMFKYARNKAERLARTRARSMSPKSRISMGPKTTRSTDSTTMSIYPNIDS